MVLSEWTFRSPDRGYALWLGRDLLGDLVLIRRWWGLGSKNGGQKVEVVADEADGMKRVQAEMRLRKRRGYALLPA